MENFWKWVTRISGVIAIILFLKSWRSNMKSIELFWNNLTPWQFIFFLVLITAFFALWRWKLNVRKGKNAKMSLNLNKSIRIIKNPRGYHYLVEGSNCYHIPDPPTFNYLGSYFGFSWSDTKEMMPDEISQKFTVGRALPSILSHCPVTELYVKST
jgi:hypothetical protein